MPEQSTFPSLTLNSPADYEIRVVGWLEESWLEFFTARSITVESESGKKPETTMVVHVPDQGALFGILNSLNLFGLPLISAHWLVKPDDNNSTTEMGTSEATAAVSHDPVERIGL